MNSLRLVGHDEPIVLVDAGLLPAQRSSIEEHVTVVDAPSDAHVLLLKQHGPSMIPADVMVLLDADIIVVRPLTELITQARKDRLITFMDNGVDAERFFPEWAETLDLPPLRRHPYVSAGQIVVPHSLATRLFDPWAEGQSRFDVANTWHAAARDDSNPFYFGDQDVLNAVIGALLEPEELITLENRLAPNPPFSGVRLVDKNELRCEYRDGSQPYLLHHFLAKPWLATTQATVYSRLMTRLVLAPDVRLRLSPSELPRRMREGRVAAVDRFRATCQAHAYSSARRLIGTLGLRTWIARRRRV